MRVEDAKRCCATLQVVVSDTHNDRNSIQVFARADGRFLRHWGGPGSAPGLFRGPWQMAVGAHKQLYVSDWGNARVQVFN